MQSDEFTFIFWVGTVALIFGLAMQPRGIIAAALFATLALCAVAIWFEG
jgi:hypothetical protein